MDDPILKLSLHRLYLSHVDVLSGVSIVIQSEWASRCLGDDDLAHGPKETLPILRSASHRLDRLDDPSSPRGSSIRKGTSQGCNISDLDGPLILGPNGRKGDRRKKKQHGHPENLSPSPFSQFCPPMFRSSAARNLSRNRKKKATGNGLSLIYFLILRLLRHGLRGGNSLE